MDVPEFWRLIAKIDRAALRDSDDEEAVEPLIAALAGCSEQDQHEFDDHLARFLFELDGRKYADEAGESGQSGDGFLYVRCYVVARGQKHYEAVIASPAKMPKSCDDWCESLLYAARRAWAAANGQDEEDWDHEAPVSYETGSNEAHWK